MVLLALLIGACSGNSGAVTNTPAVSTPGGTLPEPGKTVISAPDPRPVARAFLDAWQADKYSEMYTMLTRVGLDAITKEAFVKRFSDVAVSLTLQKMEYEILQSITNPASAQVAYRITYKTAILGDITRNNITMNLSLENKGWKIQWDEGLILPELKGGNRLQLDYKIPARGDIYDSKGKALVATMDAVALGIIPGQIPEGKDKQLQEVLAALTGKTPQAIKALYEKAGSNWYIAVGEAPAQDVNDRYDTLQSLGVVMNPFRSRYYYDLGVAPHVVGYVQPIFKKDLVEYQRKGYSGGEKVGKVGLELWGEDTLAGQRGVTLYVVSPNGQVTSRLGQRDSKPAEIIYSTLSKDLQILAQKAITGFRGAIVVLERDTGRVLTMVSSPGFDPNLFEPTNYNSGWQLSSLFTDAQRPLLNRSSQSAYPLGSVFKIITMSAALESGVYKPETTYDCGLTFRELPGVTLYDWTYEKQQPASGRLTLPEGLMRSCNPYFYHIGLDLYRQKGDTMVTDIARGFGLGKVTGLKQVDEVAGQMPNPINESDAVQMAIGQGAMLVTPLQVATFTAALGNGGTLYRPQVVEKITLTDGTPTFTFKAEATGKLPISEATLTIVRQAMRSVIENRRGTAWNVFTGLGITVYGKTGTAQNSAGDPHAWFTGYTDARRSDKPDIAIAVLAENAGEGSEIAAPIFRRVVEDYFFGKPSTLYWWESSYYVKKTPQPTATPAP